METETDGAGRAGTAASTQEPTYQERRYPRLDCVGTYVWIWERLMRAEGHSEVVARRVEHAAAPHPSGQHPSGQPPA